MSPGQKAFAESEADHKKMASQDRFSEFSSQELTRKTFGAFYTSDMKKATISGMKLFNNIYLKTSKKFSVHTKIEAFHLIMQIFYSCHVQVINQTCR